MNEGAHQPAGADLVIVGEGDLSQPVLVLGRSPDELPGRTEGKVAPQLVKRFLEAAEFTGSGLLTAELMEGRWVRLTTETVEFLETRGDFMRDQGQTALGVVRGEGGQIEHVARFVPASFNPVAAATLLSTLATQRRLAAIEQALEDLSARVDVLVEGSRIEVEARLAAALDTIRRVERRVRDQGRVDDRDWASLAETEPTVKELYHQTVRWLDPLRTALDDHKIGLSDQVRLLKDNLGVRDIGFWLRMYAYSELALKRWEYLYLLHEWDTSRERLEEESRRIEARARRRYEDLLGTYDALANYLDEEKEMTLFERTRVVSRVRLARLRAELGQIVNAYAVALDEAQRELPEFVPDDAEALTGPIIDINALRSEVGAVVGDAAVAGRELAGKAGRATAAGAKTAGRWFRRRGSDLWERAQDRRGPNDDDTAEEES